MEEEEEEGEKCICTHKKKLDKTFNTWRLIKIKSKNLMLYICLIFSNTACIEQKILMLLKKKFIMTIKSYRKLVNDMGKLYEIDK